MGDGMGFCFRACLDSRFTCELNYEREQCVPVERKVNVATIRSHAKVKALQPFYFIVMTIFCHGL